MKDRVSITSVASVSAPGAVTEEIWKKYQTPQHSISRRIFGKEKSQVAALPQELSEEMQLIRNSGAKFRHLDNSVLYALYTARKAVEKAGWSKGEEIAINVGSPVVLLSFLKAIMKVSSEPGSQRPWRPQHNPGEHIFLGSTGSSEYRTGYFPQRNLFNRITFCSQCGSLPAVWPL